MKKILLSVALMASGMSVSTYASQARLLALGMSETDNDGMYYVKDARNVFLNPAFASDYGNQVVLEWGSYGQYAMVDTTSTTKTSGTTVNSNTSSPKAQGGFFKKIDEMTYGIYLGNESNTSSLIRAASTSAAAAMNGYTGTAASASSKMLQSADNQIDLFVAGGSDVKWGANFLYAGGKDETRNGKDLSLAVRGGVATSTWDAHANVSLASKSEATDAVTVGATNLGSFKHEAKGKLGLQFGGSYEVGTASRVFGYVKHYGWEQTDNASSAFYTAQAASLGGQTGTVKGDFTSYYLGWGNELAVNNGDKVFTSLSAKKTNINLKFSNKSEVDHLVVPLTIGYEAKATDWLTLRGSVIQNIYGKRDNKNINNYGATGTRVNKVASSLISAIYGGSGETTIANSTTVNAGATLTFGAFELDGLIGTTATDGSVTTSSTSNKNGVLSIENLATSVAMTYKF